MIYMYVPVVNNLTNHRLTCQSRLFPRRKEEQKIPVIILTVSLNIELEELQL